MLKPLKLLDKPMKVFNKFIHSPSSDKGDQEEDDVESIAAKEQKLFPLETLAVATHGFHLKNKLGEGGFGHVYKGKLSDGREIAVKKLWRISSEGKREFLKEAKLLTRLQHKNVVNLLGYCARGSEKLMVYEYVCHESLDKLLFHSGKCAELDWKRRFIIILGVARGLVYLHQDSPCCMIHQDIKASNILLDDRWIPKIADFGMGRLFPENQTYMNTRVAGTNGYMAPEYLMHGTLSVKADVFSFGVLVLEIISGKKNATFSPEPGAQNLLEWAWKLYKKGESLELMDSTLSSSADIEQVAMCIQMGLLCVQADPSLRPDMARVVLILSRKTGKLDEPDRPGYPGSRYKRNSRSGSTLSGSSSARSSGDPSWLRIQANTTGSTTTTTIPRPPRQPISSLPDPSTDLVETPM